MDEKINPFERFLLAFVAFFSVLFHRDFAVVAWRYQKDRALPAAPARPELPKPQLPEAARPAAASPEAQGALHLLGILQREGRFVDFLQEDLAGFSDAEVGGAARAVHEGCRKAIGNHFALEPIYREPEGATLTLPAGFDAAAVRLAGNVVGQPPFRGTLRHHGWRAREVKLPTRAPDHDPAVVAAAEVEL